MDSGDLSFKNCLLGLSYLNEGMDDEPIGKVDFGRIRSYGIGHSVLIFMVGLVVGQRVANFLQDLQ